MPHKFTLEQLRAGGAIAGKKSFEAKTGIHGLSEAERLGNSRKGGLITGPKLGAANLASGQWDKIRNSEAAVESRLEWARSDENKKRCSEMGKKQAPNVDWSRVKTPESLRLGQARGGLASRHTRHHFNRKLFNPACPLCVAAKERGDRVWWTAIYIPSTNGNKAGKIMSLSEYEN